MSGSSKTQVSSEVVSLPSKRAAKRRGCGPGPVGVGGKPAKKEWCAAYVKLAGVWRSSQPPGGRGSGRRAPRRAAACRASRKAGPPCRSVRVFLSSRFAPRRETFPREPRGGQLGGVSVEPVVQDAGEQVAEGVDFEHGSPAEVRRDGQVNPRVEALRERDCHHALARAQGISPP